MQGRLREKRNRQVEIADGAVSGMIKRLHELDLQLPYGLDVSFVALGHSSARNDTWTIGRFAHGSNHHIQIYVDVRRRA